MPDLYLFVIGAVVTGVVVVACIIIGNAEAEDVLKRERNR